MSDIAADLVEDVSAAILVLRDRDGLAITTGQALERARNIVAGLMGNYEIRRVRDNQCSDNQGRQG